MAQHRRPVQPIKAEGKGVREPENGNSRKWNHLHLIFLLLLNSILLTFFIGVVLFFYIKLDIPDISSLSSYRPPVASTILDNHNEPVDRVFTDFRYVVPLSRMPDLLPKAFVAAEDARFFEHPGVDTWSILRALLHNIRVQGRAQGGSTITQQVTRSLLLTPEKTYIRKITEAILAYRLDTLLSKNEILHIYLNQIYLGAGSYGVAAAALTYFGKEVNQLNLAEISLLAGLPQAPSRYSPLKHFNEAKKRQVYVLNRMAADGFITPTAARKAYATPLNLARTAAAKAENQYFLQHVRNYVENKYGREMLHTGGLTIYTTMDQSLQRQAGQAIKHGVEAWKIRQKKKAGASGPQAALVAVEVGSGRIRAIIGGTDFSATQFDRAVQARRQPGSAFKPLIYAAAFGRGMTPATVVIDEPLDLPGLVPGLNWQPKNFDNKFSGPTTLRNALIQSRNIVTIKVLQEIGLPAVIGLARKMGIESPLTPNLSLALGSSGLSLLELTSAYTVFANSGKLARPIFINKIVDRDGNILEENMPLKKAALDARSAYLITHLLQLVIKEGTGRKADGLGIPAAGKTGTTDRNLDAWFIGYTPTLAAGVWFGFDDNLPLGPRETGGLAAAPVWLDFMQQAKASFQPGGDFVVPEGITFMPVDRESGGANNEEGDAESVLPEPYQQDKQP